MRKKLLLSNFLIIILLISPIVGGCAYDNKVAQKTEKRVKSKVTAPARIKTAGLRTASIPQTITNIKTVAPSLGQILSGKARVEDTVCDVSTDRKDINATILGNKTESIGNEFSFEMVNNKQALCLGEIVLLEKEVDKVVNSFLQQGLKVTAIHNHWLQDSPKLIYVHIESVMNPVEFATKVASVTKKL